MLSCIPARVSPNQHQSKAHFQAQTTKSTLANAGKLTYFWNGKYFLCYCSVKENVLEKKKNQSKKNKKGSQARNQWWGSFSGQVDILPTAWSSSGNCQTLVLVNLRPAFPERRRTAKAGVPVWQTRGKGVSQIGHVAETRQNKLLCPAAMITGHIVSLCVCPLINTSMYRYKYSCVLKQTVC